MKPGEVFGPYLVYERLGVGGMATVHRATKQGIEGFERAVALKRLLPHLADDAEFVRSFVREAKLASILQHANVVQIYELGRVGAAYFMAMELIDGYDVRQILQRARRDRRHIPVPVVLSMLLDICDALDYAHNRTDDITGEPLGIVHRDVSPSNLIVTPAGHLKVIDFGIAKATSSQLRTETGRVKGKLGYMSPEAVTGRSLDARSDLFSVGVIAHELLSVRPLFSSRSDYETLRKIQTAEVVPPSVFHPSVPEDLDDVVLRALARDPDERFQTVAELRDALEVTTLVYDLRTTAGKVSAWLDHCFGAEPPTPTDDGIVLIPGVPDVSDQIPVHFDDDSATVIDVIPPSPPRQGSSRAGTLDVQTPPSPATPPAPVVTFRSETPSGQQTPRPRAVGTTPPPARPVMQRAPSSSPTDRRGWPRVATAGLVLAAAVALGLWWQLRAPAPARVAVESTPPGLTVTVDGNALADPTPVTVELGAGRYRIALTSGDAELWSRTVEIEADTRYVLHPMLGQ